MEPDAAQQKTRAAVAAAAAPYGVTVGAVLHHTDKSAVAAGRRDGLPIIAKLLTTSDPYWVDRRCHELAVHQAFAANPPPFAAPQLLAHDHQLSLYTAIPGVRLGDERHLTADVPPATAAAVVEALDAVRRWSPGIDIGEVIPNYPDRVDAEHAAGLLTDTDRTLLHQLLDETSPARWISHGDPIPTNLLLHDGVCILVDWELSGQALPGYDHAVLHTVTAAASPALTAAIHARITALGITDTFLVNLGLVLCREIRIHHTLPAGPVRELRLATLDRLHSRWQDSMRARTSDGARRRDGKPADAIDAAGGTSV